MGMKKRVKAVVIGVFCMLLTTVTAGCGSMPASSTGDVPNQSIQIQRVSFDSTYLKKKMNMNVYLPKDYDPGKKYALLYMIHGYGGHENDWERDMELPTAAGSVFESGKVKPYIIVTPDIANSYAINSSDTVSSSGDADFGPYEDYIIHDVIGYIDAHYSTAASREGRYIGGLSMGGHAALHLGFAYTDLFSKVGGHSPAVWLEGDAAHSDMQEWLYPTKEARQQRDPLLLAESSDLSHTKIWLDCGTEDSYKFYEGTEKLYETLKAKGVQAEYHSYPGGHDAQYWSSHLEEYLIFYGAD
jgi:enterochelin esterase-like enzyme